MKVTKEQIKEWKAKYGDLFEVTVEGKTGILRKPNRKDLSYASVVKDPIKMSETLLNRLWLSGDEEIKTDDELFMATVNVMEDVLKVKEAEIKKL
ncbi:MAG: hypothetical protein IJZ22_06875 [Bacteroidaceae bacterium]|nr:hypothetical protein [Bacteroidaceae bacterium]